MLGADQNDLELRGGVNIDHLIAAPLLGTGAAPVVKQGSRVVGLFHVRVIVFIFLVFIFIRMGQLFQLIEQSHNTASVL